MRTRGGEQGEIEAEEEEEEEIGGRGWEGGGGIFGGTDLEDPQYPHHPDQSEHLARSSDHQGILNLFHYQGIFKCPPPNKICLTPAVI